MIIDKYMTGIICIIGLPNSNTEHTCDNICTCVNDLIVKQTINSIDVAKLLDYSKPISHGIYVTRMIPESVSEIDDIPKTCNALIDRYGAQRTLFIFLQDNIQSILNTAVDKTEKPCLETLDFIESQICMIRAMENQFKYLSGDAITSIGKTNILRITKQNDVMSKYAIESIANMLLIPLATRVTEPDSIYENAILKQDYIQYSNYANMDDDPETWLAQTDSEGKPIPSSMRSLKTIIADYIKSKIDKESCADYFTDTWIDETAKIIKRKIYASDIIKKRCMMNEHNRSFLTSYGFVSQNGDIVRLDNTNILPPKVSMSENNKGPAYEYNNPNSETLNIFKDLFGTYTDHLTLADFIRSCLYPGENRGTYYLIQYNHNTEKECRILTKVIHAIAYCKKIKLDNPDPDVIKARINHPANAYVIELITTKETEHINPCTISDYDKIVTNEIFVRTGISFDKDLINDPSTRLIKLHHVPGSEDILSIDDFTKTTALKDILQFCLSTFVNQ